VAWLRSPEGEEWSRSRTLERAEGEPVVCPCPETMWRPAGLLNAGSDPCGRPGPRVSVQADDFRVAAPV
jgi:hypothetical protein